MTVCRSVFLVLAAAALASAAQDIPLPAVSSDITDGGTEICVIEMPSSPVVAARVYLPGGVLAEGEKAGSGLALAALQFLRAALDAGKLAPAHTPYLGRAEAELDSDGICLSLLATRDGLDEGLRALADAVCTTNLDDTTWRSIRERVAQQMALDEKDNAFQLRALYRRAANAWNPQSAPLRGELRQFLGVRRQDMLAYCDRVRASGNVRVVIAGDVDATAALRSAAVAFSRLPHGTSLPLPSFEQPIDTGTRRIERHADVSQSWVCIGFSLGREGEDDTAAQDVALQLLGSHHENLATALVRSAPTMSRIELAEELGPRGRRALLVLFQVATNETASSTRAAVEWFRDSAAARWSPEAVKAESAAMQARFLALMGDPEFIVRVAGNALVRCRNPQYPMLRARRWSSVTPEAIGRAATAGFSPARTITAVLMPGAGESASPSAVSVAERALVGGTHYPTRQVILENGATLLLRRNPQAPAVWFACGTISGLWCEQALDNGTFALVGEAMCQATEAMPHDAFDAACRAIGLQLRTEVWPQHVELSGSVAPGNALEAARLLCAVWATPRLDPADVRAAVAIVARRQAAQHFDPTALADWLFRASRFARQPYRLNTMGSLPLVQRIGAAEIARVHRDFISPRTTLLIVDGAFDEQDMEQAVRTAWRTYADAKRSDQFFQDNRAFELRSAPPALTVKLPAEPALTAAVTRVFSAPGPDALVICGIPVPSSDDTNYPPHMALLVRGALLHTLAPLVASWRDEDETPVVRGSAVAARDWYGTAWAYGCIRVPPSMAGSAVGRLTTVLTSTLAGLADGSLIPAARARALAEEALDGRIEEAVLDRILFDELFGRTSRLPKSPDVYLDQCTAAACARMAKEYGSFPVTVIATPNL